MPIQFECPECGEPYDLPDEARGRKAKCACGAMLVVPLDSSAIVEVLRDKAPNETPVSRSNAATEVNASDHGQAVNEDSDRSAFPTGFAESSSSMRPSTTASTQTKYRKLREYAGNLRFTANLAYLVAAFASLAMFAFAFEWKNQTISPPGAIGATIGSLVACGAAYGFALVLKALAEFLNVIMDIEENTRSR